MSIKNLSCSQRSAGLITLSAMLLAFALANSSAREWYQVVHHLPVMVRVGALTIDKPLILWINDGLMVFFFLLIALELKREILEGQLSTPRSIATPGFAALGGMVVLALIYIAFNAGDPAAMRGWAIPTATDTVLALTVLVLLGARAPVSLKVFLTALAIFDDLGGDRGHCAVLYRATCHAVAGDGGLMNNIPAAMLRQQQALSCERRLK